MDGRFYRDPDGNNCRSCGCVCPFPWGSGAFDFRIALPVAPVHLSAHYALTLSTAQLVALLVIALLTATNTLGIEYGKIIQNSFTVAKLGALGALIVLGLTVGWNASSVHANLATFWQRPATPHPVSSLGAILSLVMVFCVSQSGSLFAADSWHDITFASEEVKDPRTTLPRALAIGMVIVMLLYLAANVAYLAVLDFSAIQHAPHDRVATAMLQQIFPAWGGKALAAAHHGVDLWLHQQPGAGRAARLLRHGAGQAVRSRGRAVEWGARAGLVSAYAGYLGRDAGAADDVLAGSRATAISTAICLTTSSRRRCCFTFLPLPRWWCCDTSGRMRNVCIARRVIRWFRRFMFLGASAVVLCLFIDRPATTWPGLVLVIAGLPVYWLIRRKAYEASSHPFTARCEVSLTTASYSVQQGDRWSNSLTIRHQVGGRQLPFAAATPYRYISLTSVNARTIVFMLAVLGRECVRVSVHLPGQRRARQDENPVSEGYVLILLDGVVQCWRLGVKDMLPQRIGSK